MKVKRSFKVASLLRIFDLSSYMPFQQAVKRLPFLLFLVGIAIVYIWNRHSAERNIRQMNRIEKDLVELQWYYDTTKDELTRKSRQSAVAERVREFGVHELRNPPYIIKQEDEEH